MLNKRFSAIESFVFGKFQFSIFHKLTKLTSLQIFA
jgi:hypothetical protein